MMIAAPPPSVDAPGPELFPGIPAAPVAGAPDARALGAMFLALLQLLQQGRPAVPPSSPGGAVLVPPTLLATGPAALPQGVTADAGAERPDAGRAVPDGAPRPAALPVELLRVLLPLVRPHAVAARADVSDERADQAPTEDEPRAEVTPRPDGTADALTLAGLPALEAATLGLLTQMAHPLEPSAPAPSAPPAPLPRVGDAPRGAVGGEGRVASVAVPLVGGDAGVPVREELPVEAPLAFVPAHDSRPPLAVEDTRVEAALTTTSGRGESSAKPAVDALPLARPVALDAAGSAPIVATPSSPAAPPIPLAAAPVAAVSDGRALDGAAAQLATPVRIRVAPPAPDGDEGRPRPETDGVAPLAARSAVPHGERLGTAAGERGAGDSRDEGSRPDLRGPRPEAGGDRAEGSVAAPEMAARPAAAAMETPARAEAAAPPRPLAEQIVARIGPLREGRHELSLRLDPPELGGVRIDAVLEGRHLTLQITTEQESAKSALEGTLPRLRESLAQQGFVTDRLTVDLGLGASAREFAGRGFGAFDRAPAPEPALRAPAPAVPTSRRLAPRAEGLDLWV